jgi:hypothetical protein
MPNAERESTDSTLVNGESSCHHHARQQQEESFSWSAFLEKVCEVTIYCFVLQNGRVVNRNSGRKGGVHDG